MARIKERIARLENQNRAALIPALTEEERAFISQCYDWIESKTQPDLTVLTDWQREMFGVCVTLTEEYC